MKLTPEQFRNWQNKSVTFIGMSGVGKTYLSNLLRQHNWFHYSGDYRIGTRYLGEPILDHIKQQAMKVPFLRDLLRSDSIYICNNMSVDHLKPVSSFLGKLGNPEHGGLPLDEFKRRQALHREAEICAMKDVPEFIRKAQEIYGYQHFINDTGGSVCELDDEEVLRVLDQHTVVLYIKATNEHVDEVIKRAESDPKPLYYREAFLNEELDKYKQEKGVDYVAQIEPDEFMRWVFPRLFRSRIPRYEALANKYGYTVSSEEIDQAHDESSFLALLEDVIARQQ